MCVASSCVNGSNIVALRFGDYGAKEMLGVHLFAQSLTSFKLCATTCNRTQHVTSNSVGSCCPTVLHSFSGKHACVSLKIDETCVRDGFFSLRKQPFLLALRRCGRFARRNVRETSSAAKSEEKRLFSQARFFLTVCLMIRTPLHVPWCPYQPGVIVLWRFAVLLFSHQPVNFKKTFSFLIG